MHTTIYYRGGIEFIEHHADRPMLKAPVIDFEYNNQGTRMYKGMNGKDYDAIAYDNYFNPTKGRSITERQLLAIRRLTNIRGN